MSGPQIFYGYDFNLLGLRDTELATGVFYKWSIMTMHDELASLSLCQLPQRNTRNAIPNGTPLHSQQPLVQPVLTTKHGQSSIFRGGKLPCDSDDRFASQGRPSENLQIARTFACSDALWLIESFSQINDYCTHLQIGGCNSRTVINQCLKLSTVEVRNTNRFCQPKFLTFDHSLSTQYITDV